MGTDQPTNPLTQTNPHFNQTQSTHSNSICLVWMVDLPFWTRKVNMLICHIVFIFIYKLSSTFLTINLFLYYSIVFINCKNQSTYLMWEISDFYSNWENSYPLTFVLDDDNYYFIFFGLDSNCGRIFNHLI